MRRTPPRTVTKTMGIGRSGCLVWIAGAIGVIAVSVVNFI